MSARRGALLPLLALAAAIGCGRDPQLRVTVVGVDGVAWRVIDPMLADGELPNLGGLKSLRNSRHAPQLLHGFGGVAWNGTRPR